MSEDLVIRESICLICGQPLPPAPARKAPALGFCAPCAGELGIVPVEDLWDLPSKRVDSLPFGFIRLDAEGAVKRFNAYESRASGLNPRAVVGRNFFRDIAPCTLVQEFAGRYEHMVREDLPAAESFQYLFRFAGGERLVQIFVSYMPDKREGLIIVRELSHI